MNEKRVFTSKFLSLVLRHRPETIGVTLDDRRTQHILTYTDPQSQVTLRCEAIEYHDFPTMEWTLYFRNAGRSDSPIIENIQALDIAWQRGADCEFLLHHAVGSPANGSDYGPLETPLMPGATQRMVQP